MKKILSYAAGAALVCLVAASCSHDNYSGPGYEDPSLEKNEIDSFINANAYAMVEDPNNEGLMYQIINWGDTTKGRLTQDSAVAVIKYKTRLLDGVTIDSTASDTTALINFGYNPTQFKPNIPTASNAFLGYLARLGKGGEVRLVIPSLYAYGSQSETINGIVVPANSPLYYEIQFIDKRPTTSF